MSHPHRRPPRINSPAKGKKRHRPPGGYCPSQENDAKVSRSGGVIKGFPKQSSNHIRVWEK